MKTILSALIALSFLAGIAVPTGGAMAARDQWTPQYRSQKPIKSPKIIRNLRNNDDDIAADDDDDDANEWPEWADEAF
jgi:hypothetical protein